MKPIPITMRQIDYVIAAAQEGSTAAAARALHVSQPSVSLAISKVEDQLGRPLFVRNAGQGLVPTTFGYLKLGEFRILRTQAEQVFAQGGAIREVLDLGVFSTLGPRYAPSLVRAYEKAHSNVHIRLHDGNLKTLTDWLESGQIDMALTYEFGLPSTLKVTSLADIRPYGLVCADHPLAGCDAVTMAELLADPLILMSLPHSRGYFLTLAQMHGITPRIAFETGSVEMLRSMVANGMGVGLLATDVPHGTTYDGQPIVRLPLLGELAPHRVALVRSERLKTGPLGKSFCAHAVTFFGQ